MSGSPRPFDDGRFPDLEGFAECFLCGKWVDPLSNNRGFYSMGNELPSGTLAGADLPIHLTCANGRSTTTNPLDPSYPSSIACAYRRAIDEMFDRQLKLLPRA